MDIGAIQFGAVDLTTCDREPIHIPGSIQPHGVLLAIDPDTLAVVQIAGDSAALLGRDPADLLGQSLNVWFGPVALERLSLILAENQLLPRPFFILETSIDDIQLDVAAHISGGLLVLEFERRGSAPYDGVAAVQSMLSRLQMADGVPALVDIMASEVQRTTGFDRVMVYQFLEDDSGHVVAESRGASDVDSFLDLHYPASDIPAQARELYRSCWIRNIPDARYTAMQLTPANNPKTGGPLDLRYSALRSVSPLHLEYLGNMGVRASMSLSLVIGDRLWGLIACHAAEPIYLNCRLRGALELFAQLASLQLRSQLQVAETSERIQARKILGALVNAMSRLELQEGLVREQPNLLDFISASGVTIRVDGENSSLGSTPDDRQIEGIAAWLNGTMSEGVYATDRLGEAYPAALKFQDRAAGLLALSVSRSPRDYVLWFLPEVAKTVTWAGNPEKPVEPSAFGDRLTPRKSFEAWTETVKGRSRPWRDAEIEASTALRIAILEVVLHRVDQLARERAKAYDHQDMLMAELDHRVKNTLATIQAMVRYSSKSAVDLVTYTKTIERRLTSMAQAHSIMTDNRWMGAAVRTLVEQELSAYRAVADNAVTIEGDDFVLDSRASMSLALVLHELTTNSVKYGCLSVAAGTLAVTWKETSRDGAQWLEIDWIERCGPPVRPPERRGFGRTLLDRVFPKEVDGRVTLAFRPEGVQCVLELPFEHVVTPVDGPRAETEIREPSVPRISSHLTLDGVKVLMFEDNALIARDLGETLIEHGVTLLGPFGRREEGVATALEGDFDVALLDIDMRGQPIWPIAHLIRGRGIPIVLTTGYSNSDRRPPEFIGTPMVPKPCDADLLVRTLAYNALRRPDSDARPDDAKDDLAQI